MQQKIVHMRGFGIAEVVVIVAAIVLLAVIVAPIFIREKHPPGQTQCQSNQRQITLAFLMYANEHNETLPEASIAWSLIGKEDKKVFKCPNSADVANSYVYNAILSNKRIEETEDPTTIFSTADGTSSPIAGTYANVAYDLTNISTTRHADRFIASFADGHVETTKSADVAHWLPATSQSSSELKCTATIAVPLTTTIPNAAWEVTTGEAENVVGLPKGGMLGGELTFNKSGIYMITAKGTATANGPTTVYRINVVPNP